MRYLYEVWDGKGHHYSTWQLANAYCLRQGKLERYKLEGNRWIYRGISNDNKTIQMTITRVDLSID